MCEWQRDFAMKIAWHLSQSLTARLQRLPCFKRKAHLEGWLPKNHLKCKGELIGMQFFGRVIKTEKGWGFQRWDCWQWTSWFSASSPRFEGEQILQILPNSARWRHEELGFSPWCHNFFPRFVWGKMSKFCVSWVFQVRRWVMINSACGNFWMWNFPGLHHAWYT